MKRFLYFWIYSTSTSTFKSCQAQISIQFTSKVLSWNLYGVECWKRVRQVERWDATISKANFVKRSHKWTKSSLLLLLRSSVKALANLLPSLAGVFSRTQPMIIGNSPKLVSWTPKSWNSRAETGSLHHLQILKFPHRKLCDLTSIKKLWASKPRWSKISVGKINWKIDL